MDRPRRRRHTPGDLPRAQRPDGRNRPYIYNVTATSYESAEPIPATRSLVLQIDNDTGGAHQGHPASAFHAFNFDLAKQAPITFDALFKPGTRPLDVLNPIARCALLELLPSQCQNFALTDDEVIFFFGEGQVIPDNSGPHQISVPRSELAPLMA